MSLKIWIGSEYDYTHENAMASEAIALLKQTYDSLQEECHVLVNFKIPGDPPRKPGDRPYVSTIDLAILKPKNLVIVDLKNYNGSIVYGDACAWICHGADKDVEIHGGAEGRTPHGQLCDYRRQMIALLTGNQSLFLTPRSHVRALDIRRFTSGMVLFPALEGASDTGQFESECGRWLSVRRMDKFVETVCAQCGGRDAELSSIEIDKLIRHVFKLSPAHMVGGVPKVGAEPVTAPVSTPVVKFVTVEKPVEVRIEVPKIVRDEYGAILLSYESDDPNGKKVSDMSDIFRRLVARERKRRFRETQVRSLGTAAEMLLRDDPNLSHCAVRLFRLSAAVYHNKDLVLTEQDVNETFKTLCRVAEKFSGEPMPPELQQRCDKIAYRAENPAPMAVSADLKAFFLEVMSVDVEKGVFIGRVRDDEIQTEYQVRLPENGLQLAPGMAVCAVTPILDAENVLKAAEIVLEPDYLLSPQSIGGASVYPNAHVYYWLNLIRDDPGQKYKIPGGDGITMEGYIQIGNFANSCLAECCAGGETPARDLIVKFFRANALQMADADPSGNWVDECRSESANVSHLLTQILPNEHSINDRLWQIEAPLYSPHFGLSARADALSYAPDRTGAAVIELKSGKWNTFHGDFPKKEHVCQPAFYSNILGFSVGIKRDNVAPFLYYGKTIPRDNWNEQKNGRNFYRPTLNGMAEGQTIRHFVNIRNKIIMMDAQIRENTFRQIVEKLRVEDFRSAEWMKPKKDGSENGMWLSKLPELQEMLSVFQSASDLEKDYFYRMLRFVAEESLVTRIGDSGAEIGRGGESMTWRLSVRKRREAGMRYSELVRLPQEGDMDRLGRIVSLTFDTTHDRCNSGCKLRLGDGVSLYLDGPDANITNSVVFSAVIAKLEPGRVVLTLENAQPEGLFGFSETARFAVESAPMSSASNYKSLWHFLSGDPRRRQLVLNNVSPEVNQTAQLPVPLDQMEQRYCGVSSWLDRAWRAKDWFLLWGPPGTGKTSHAMRALVDEAMAVPGKKILLLAYTYKAADQICKMLEARIRETNGEPYLRIGKTEKCDAAYRARIPEEMDLPDRQTVRRTLAETRIFVSTVSTLTPKHAVCGLVKHFDLAIIDEASQLLDTHILPLFCSRRQDGGTGPLVDKFILIGDDRQLPAVVQQEEKTSAIEEPSLKDLGFRNCRESFFARLKRSVKDNPAFVGLLDTQFRMHPMIADFCNQYFYNGRLRNGNAPHQQADLPTIPREALPFERYVLSTRLGFFPMTEGRTRGAKTSEIEAKTCADIVRTILKGNNRPSGMDQPPCQYKAKDIGIIVPFRNQIACVRETIAAELGPDVANEIAVVDTVERSQGGEYPVVLFTTVVTSADQADWISAKRYDDDDDGDTDDISIDRKLNVAITRAQERFYLVGCERVLNGLRAYGDLLRWITDHAGFCEASVKDLF